MKGDGGGGKTRETREKKPQSMFARVNRVRTRNLSGGQSGYTMTGSRLKWGGKGEVLRKTGKGSEGNHRPYGCVEVCKWGIDPHAASMLHTVAGKTRRGGA